jgi:hypothetical protein
MGIERKILKENKLLTLMKDQDTDISELATKKGYATQFK